MQSMQKSTHNCIFDICHDNITRQFLMNEDMQIEICYPIRKYPKGVCKCVLFLIDISVSYCPISKAPFMTGSIPRKTIALQISNSYSALKGGVNANVERM